MKNTIIIGGGISGLITGIQLSRAGIPCTLIEKKVYPFHRVCGEYISNEALPFLKNLGLYPESLSPASMHRLQLSDANGRSVVVALDSGGFGISRFAFDQFLYERAKAAGVEFKLGTQADSVQFRDDRFLVTTKESSLEADVVVGSYGKRSSIDISLGRSFIKKRSPYLGVKYHVRVDRPRDMISLHNFRNGYCGVSSVENGITNLCYLSHHQNLKEFGTIRAMEEGVLFKNPFLNSIFNQAQFVFEKPETISEISFETKGPVDDHILMTGDAAGMITPLSGNGIAMAIHSSKVLSGLLIRHCTDSAYTRLQLESDYTEAWKGLFERRLSFGRRIQRLFGREWASASLVQLARLSDPAAQWFVRKTHGTPF